MMICILCGEDKHNYLYVLHGIPLWQCTGCGLIFSYPQSFQDDLHGGYDKDGNPLNAWATGKTEKEATERYLDILSKHVVNAQKILLVAPPSHCFSSIAQRRGFEIIQHLTIRDFEQTKVPDQFLDAIIFLYQLEKCSLLGTVLDKAYNSLKPGGVLMVVAPSLDSRPARFFRSAWTEWRPENNYYFDDTTIQSLLWKYGFNNIWVEDDLRWYTLAHINDRVSNFPKTWITRTINLTYRLLPTFLHKIYFRLPTSGRVVIAKKFERRELQRLSIVVPVFNEGLTFSELIGKLINKQIDNIEKEIIIVESNSSDNSRELVMGYKDYPGIKIILQDNARGKGNAVRAGLQQATGDVILIQDADLEYDLNDYESLLEPVMTFKRPFVLGSRHGGRWKMRHFNDQEHLSAYFNFGHKIFTFLMNFLYGQRMKDPFTMFKIFRRDCLHNLVLECDRFDFDFELVIKLIRKGYIPLEIPVNYNSRSFREGKKVRIFSDPLTWIRALVKYRFTKIMKE